MPFFTVQELFDLVIMALAVGFIFKDYFKPRTPVYDYDPLKDYKRLDLEAFKFSILVTVPAIALHELSHKFIAMLFGLSATFHASYGGLLLGIILKLANFPFIFFVPAFVSISGGTNMLEMGLSAFAGPAMNLLLFLLCTLILKAKLVKVKYYPIVYLTKQVNLFLFIFNMIPIPGFDGFSFYEAVFRTIF